ncbi:hypothetical protein PINS_up010375 [Pythium insidiosum]|nr:hypothetical protein PINS_up010375 [Pythium insidiosum]
MGNVSTTHLLEISLVAQPKYRPLVALHGSTVRSTPVTLCVEEATWASDTVVRESETSTELYRAKRDGFGGPLVLSTPPSDDVLCLEAASLKWLYRVKLGKNSDDVLFSVSYDSNKMEADLVNVSLNRMARVVIECVHTWQDEVAVVVLESESGEREPIARFPQYVEREGDDRDRCGRRRAADRRAVAHSTRDRNR